MAFDIIRFCKDYGIPYATQGKQISRGWVGLQDVFNKSNDRDWHLACNIAGGYLNSWIDGSHTLKSWLEIVAPDDDFHSIMQEYGDEISYVNRLNDKVINATHLEFNFPELGKVARKYIYKRGFDVDELISKYKFRDGGITGEWAYRVIIPIIDRDNRIVSWQGRAYAGQDLRYKTLSLEKSLVDPKKMLFNLNNCNKDYVMCVEGPFDALKFGDDCCATLGTSVTESQIQLLAEYKRVFIIFDSGEIAAQNRARKLATRVSALGVTSVTVVDTETEEDIGGMSYEEVAEIKEKILHG